MIQKSRTIQHYFCKIRRSEPLNSDPDFGNAGSGAVPKIATICFGICFGYLLVILCMVFQFCRSTISIVHGVRIGLMAIYELGGEGFLSNKQLLTSPAHHIRYEFSVEQTIVQFVENLPMYSVLDEVLGRKIPHLRKKSGK